MIKLGDIIWTGHVAITGDVIHAYRNSDGKYEGNWLVGRQRYRMEDGIKIDVNGREKSL